MVPKDSPDLLIVSMNKAISEYEYLPADPHGADHSGHSV
jgi:hypothetical protein